jgi:putative glutamine amidotransferase
MSTSAAEPRPLVLLPSCNRIMSEQVFHIAGKKYVDALRLAGCQALIVPGLNMHEGPDEIDDVLRICNGILLTGSPSNVHPSHFEEEVHNPALPLDPDRDNWTLPLIRRALSRGIPLFAICRGFQETNVALGGSLHQAVHEVPGHADHRDMPHKPDACNEERYRKAHPVQLQAGGMLQALLGTDTIDVNSLHGQGIKRLAPGLRVEAIAPDGLIEAFTKADAPAFNLSVQWHPEWQAAHNPVSTKLFQAFGQACQAHARKGSTEDFKTRP